ncbi:MAG: CopG family transcriptional regulator [Rickettsiales bacterium]|nr:MAG: CopG family transcriptional regulator [Rickettsiales bacterium]
MIRTQIYIDEDNKKAIERFCTYTGRSQSEIIREAISLYIKNQILTGNNSAFGIWRDNQWF